MNDQRGVIKWHGNFNSQQTLTYLFQIYITIIYIQSLVYWACTKLYSTQQIYSQHRPGVGAPGSPNFPSYDNPLGAASSQAGKRVLNGKLVIWSYLTELCLFGSVERGIWSRKKDVVLILQQWFSLSQADHSHWTACGTEIVKGLLLWLILLHHFAGESMADSKDPFAKEKELLSWQWCDACQINRPPRAQHCKLCNVCVIKRVHHCYILNCCIGFSNQVYLW